ncbi:MAG: phosphoenolpyruvate synthase, partial [bacterium]|nr:phosphoenolpyruvate synthase [bacterium]
TFSRLLAVRDQLRTGMLENWHTPIVNDFLVMMATGRLRRWVEASGVGDPEAVLSVLLAGDGDEGLESTEPTRRLLMMAAEARRDPALSAALRAATATEAWARVGAGWPEFAVALDAYVERYGDRVMGELKLETITLRQDPAFLHRVLCDYLDRPDLDPDRLGPGQRRRRAAAEAQVAAGLGLGARHRFRRTLRTARTAVRDREAMRLCRTRMFGLFRDVYLAIGDRLCEAGRLATAREVFYLTQEEIDGYDEGRAVTADLAALVRVRKAEYAAWEELALPHHFATRGPVYHGNRYAAPPSGPVDAAASTLSGIPCCPGVAEAAARVVFSPRDERPVGGKILVAVRTDPGWTPLFPTVAGILVERGSTLSHSAVVAREFGIPAIVGIRDLTRIVAEGERLRIDGATGIVQRLGSAP